MLQPLREEAFTLILNALLKQGLPSYLHMLFPSKKVKVKQKSKSYHKGYKGPTLHVGNWGNDLRRNQP